MSINKQWYLIGLLVLVLALLLVFGKTVNPNKVNNSKTASQPAAAPVITIDTILNSAKAKINFSQAKYVQLLESLTTSNNISAKIDANNKLATFWKDSAHLFEPYAFYTGEAAKLENSEKKLTFAAQQFIDNLLAGGDPAVQNWLATQAKDLLNQALKLNPDNDSSKIGLGACYILGNISNNPMEGILPVREVAAKNPDNLYAQMVLGIGGRKSTQYDKAIERFLIVATKDPKNLIAIINLAECYELKGDKPNAVKWYNQSKKLVQDAMVLKEIEKRINELK